MVKRFNKGDSVARIFSANFLNHLVERVAQLEDMTAYAPLKIVDGRAGLSLSLGQRIDNFEPVELISDLDAFSSAPSEILVHTAQSNSIKESTLSLTVIDIFSISSKSGTRGLAFKHTKSDEEIWLFLPIVSQTDSPGEYVDPTYTVGTADVPGIYNSFVFIDVNVNITRENNFFFFDCDESSFYQLDSATPVTSVLNLNCSFTVWFKFYFVKTSQDQVIFSIGAEDTDADLELILDSASNRMVLNYIDVDGNSQSLTHTLPIQSDRWYTAWVTYSHCLGQIRLWVGDEFGNSKAAVEATNLPGGLQVSVDQSLTIGRSVDSTNANFFCGFMDEFFFQAESLSAEDLCKRWNKGETQIITLTGDVSSGGSGSVCNAISPWIVPDAISPGPSVANANNAKVEDGIFSIYTVDIPFFTGAWIATSWLIPSELPGAAEICGLEFKVLRKTSESNNFKDADPGITLSTSNVSKGISFGADRSNETFITTTLETILYGGPEDLWDLNIDDGEKFLISDIPIINLEFHLEHTSESETQGQTTSVDLIAMRIYYKT